MPRIEWEQNYNIDIALCIDATASMKQPIEELKANVKKYYSMLVEAIEYIDGIPERNVHVRVKVITFRDYGRDAEPMKVSRFFTIGEESEAFLEYLNGIKAYGGGDEPENGLEAIALAMKSDWVRTGFRRRHVIVVFTDASALPLGERANETGYPDDIPANFSELKDWWHGSGMERRIGRLLLLAPDEHPWKDMTDWDNTYHVCSKAGVGCDDYDLSTCIHFLTDDL